MDGGRTSLQPNTIPYDDTGAGQNVSTHNAVMPVKKDNLKILQLNMHRSKDAALNLRRIFDEGHTDLAFLQEPWVYKNQIKGLNSKSREIWTWTGTRSTRPRACIVVSDKFQSSLLQEYSDADQVAIQMRVVRDGKEQNIIFCSVYMPFDSPEAPPNIKLIELINFTKTNNLQLIIGCDANAHHLAWGSTDINSRGAKLLEFIASTDLEILNNGNEPTFVTRVRSPDLSRC